MAAYAVDTTGAGDAFWGAVLSRISAKSLPQIQSLSIKELERIVDIGNAAGSLTTTKKVPFLLCQ
ncbi:PfkB family carbohydrate kinase [Ruthenibacterium lactatiformans]|uniref:PfkB family carbohydrate kinase n=1 Tax=Ruthenibacterium lactatiformans TaxID=1550024 RepID=UPI00311A9E89